MAITRAWIKRYWAEIFLICASALAFVYKLGSLKFFDGDETTYYYVAHNINKTGQWLTLLWRQPPSGPLVPFFDKPPLMYWLRALLIRLPGQVEFWDRLPSALAGIGTVLVVYAIGKRLYGKATGLVAASLCICTPGLFHIFRIGQLDGPSTFFFWLALYFAIRLKEHPKFYYWLGAAVGLGVMTKGAANLLVVPIIAITWLWGGEFIKQMRNRHLWTAVGIALAVGLPWHIAETIVHGRRFWQIYVGVQLLERTHGILRTPGLAGDALQPTFYFKLLNALFFPWVYAMPFAFGLALRDTLRRRRDFRLIIVTLVVIFGFFTYAGTKLSQYIIPALPALAILVANLMAEVWQNRRQFVHWLLWPAGLLGLYFFPFILRPGHALGLSLLFALGLIGCMVLRPKAWRTVLSSFSLIVLLVASSFQFTTGLRAYRADYRRFDLPVALLAAEAASRYAGPIVMYPVDVVYNDSLPISVAMAYSDRAIYPAYNLGILAEALKDGYHPVIVQNDWLHLLPRHFDFQKIEQEGEYTLVHAKHKGN